jgi:hypothetical protein
MDECKEGGDGALLRAGERGDGDPADFSPQSPHGQMQGWRHATACYSASGRSLYAPVPCACCCAGAGLVQNGASPRTDGRRNSLCELCPTRLSRGGPHRPRGAGRAHVTCILRTQRAAACAHASATAALPPPCLALSGRSTRCVRRRSASARSKRARPLLRCCNASVSLSQPSSLPSLPLLQSCCTSPLLSVSASAPSLAAHPLRAHNHRL